MSDGDIYNNTAKLRRTTKRIEEDQTISDRNKELLFQFRDYLYSQDLSTSRIVRYLYSWHRFLEVIDYPLDQANKQDLIRLIGQLNRGEIKEMAEQTKREYKKAVKKFYGDFIHTNYEDIDGESMVDFFTLTVKTRNYMDPDELPRPEHVRELMHHAPRLRDKAFIMTLWSTGGRIGEILGLRWKDVKLRTDIATVTFRDTKTGGNRTVPLHTGFLYLRDLREQDPHGTKPEAFVFRTIHQNNQLKHSAARNIILRTRDRTNIPDQIRTNPHAFRKGRATFLAAQGMNQAQLCRYFGWVHGSKESAKYIRMAESDVENGIRKISGLTVEEEEHEQDLTPIKCHDCGELNKFEAANCHQCSTLLETTELYTEMQVQNAKDVLKTRMIQDGLTVDDDRVEKLAEEVVRENLAENQG